MNNCPNCHKKPISLAGWCKSTHSISCKSCGVALAANRYTWLVWVAIVLIMATTAYLSITHYGVHFKQDRLLLIGLVLASGLISSIIGYFIGGYRIKKWRVK